MAAGHFGFTKLSTMAFAVLGQQMQLARLALKSALVPWIRGFTCENHRASTIGTTWAFRHARLHLLWIKIRRGEMVPDAFPIPIWRGRADCAPAPTDNVAAAAPLTSVMNSLRLIRSPRRRGPG